MKKIFTKLIGVTLGLAMAVGVGVGVAAGNRAAMGLDADSEAISIGDIADANEWANDTAYKSWSLNSYISITTAGTGNNGKYYTSNKSWRLYEASNGALTLSGVSGVNLSSVTFTYTNSNNGVLYKGENNYTSGTEILISGQSYSFDGVKHSSGTKNGNIQITNISITYSAPGSATISSISLSGNMTKTSYTTVDSWSNAGLTPTVTMSDSSQYTGSVAWTYSPTTPAAAVVANSNDEVSELTVTATATAGGKSASKATTGINVSYATVAQLTAATPAEGVLAGVIAKGIVSQVDEVSVNNGNATYWISDDGSTTNQYNVYRGKKLGNTDFTNSSDIQVGDNVLVYGNVTNYNGTKKQFQAGNYILKFDRPASSDPSIVINETNFTTKVGDADVQLSANAQNVPDGGEVLWSSGTTSVATVTSEGLVHAVAAGSSEITAKIVDSELNVVASNSITVSVVEDALADGDTFVIKATYSEQNYYLTGVESNIGTVNTNSSDAMIFTAIEGATAGQFQFKNGSNYLKSVNSNNLNITNNDEDTSTLWTALNNGSGTVIESVSYTGRKLQYNHNSDPGDNTKNRFACYTSVQTAISIEMVIAPEVDSVTVYGDSTADAKNALSITKDFLYEVTYVDPLNPGNGAISVAVLNSSDEEEGASVTSAPDGSSFSVTFTASDTYTIAVTSVENPAKSDSTSITVSNIYVPPVPVSHDFDLYNDDTLVEGDYIIFNDGAVMNNTIDSDRAQYEEATPADNKISTDDASIIWHIAPAGNYFTIYNAEVGKYLASTGAKNKAQLFEDGSDDKSLWSFSGSDGSYEFVNKQNATNEVNANLRKNGTYGFACYGTGTGSALSLYRLNDIDAYLSNASSIATLTDDILRLGSSVSVETWNSIAATAEVTDYGVMVYKTDSEAKITSETPVEDAYRAGEVLPAIARKGSGTAPTAVDGNCEFTVRMRVSNPDTIFCSASFMVVGGQYYFFNEQHVTARQFA